MRLRRLADVNTSYEHREEFSIEEYASIGCLVRSLANLEYQIARTTLVLLGGPPFSDTQTEAKAARVVKASLKKRLILFAEAYKDSSAADSWLATFSEEVGELSKWRDGVCHGVWSRGNHDEMKLVFYDRVSFENDTDIPVQVLTAQEIKQMSNSANYWAWALHERFSLEEK